MKKNSMMAEALSSYERDIKRLKNCSPDWKPIALKEYILDYKKNTKNKTNTSHS